VDNKSRNISSLCPSPPGDCDCGLGVRDCFVVEVVEVVSQLVGRGFDI